MPIISKISFATAKAVNFQGYQQQTISMPVMPKYGIQRDTVSFKAHEDIFLENLRKLCKEGWNNHLGGKIQVIARGVDSNHPDVIAEFDKIKEDSSIPKRVKYFVFEELPGVLGKGGLEKL